MSIFTRIYRSDLRSTTVIDIEEPTSKPPASPVTPSDTKLDTDLETS